MGLLKNIYWKGDNSKKTIVYRFDMKNDYVSKGSNLTVEPGQACVFSHQGKIADVFLPGRYKLDTDSIPVLTKLMSWKYGFENPFRSNVYFVNTTQFTNQKWGTMNPIMVRDKDYGAVRIRGYGSYAFQISDPKIFMDELSGTNSTFTTDDIVDHLKSIVIMGITDAIGESKIPVLDMAANLMELSKMVEKSLDEDFDRIGVKLTKFVFENFSMPEELEKALDRNTSLGMRRGTMDVEMQLAQAEALKEAAKNPGAGGSMGAGMGMGMGLGMGQMFGGMFNQMNQQNQQNQQSAQQPKQAGNFCSQCGAGMSADAKFCPECGAKQAAEAACKKCGTKLKPGAKFCPECGEKQ